VDEVSYEIFRDHGLNWPARYKIVEVTSRYRRRRGLTITRWGARRFVRSERRAVVCKLVETL
jgi:aminoglycoside phosphotransferase (APT) family kinase protein